MLQRTELNRLKIINILMFKYFSDDNPYCDPPDVFDLFQFYNTYFFENTLEACQLKWSKRMTLCAGKILQYRRYM